MRFEVLVSRRRPPAGPPGCRGGTAEALSSQRAMVEDSGGWTAPPRTRGQWSEALPGLSQRSRSERGHRTGGHRTEGLRPPASLHVQELLNVLAEGPGGSQRGGAHHGSLAHLLHGPMCPAL